MFVIVIYDSRTRSVVIARDRFGIKPLYYSQTGRGLAISSEIKPLLSAGLVRAEPDLDALGELALFRYVADPNTPFKNIASVPPGSIARVDTDATIHFTRYWKPEYEQASPGPAQPDSEATRLLKETIDQTIRSQFVADVKVGLELSGGVDPRASSPGQPEARGSRDTRPSLRSKLSPKKRTSITSATPPPPAQTN